MPKQQRSPKPLRPESNPSLGALEILVGDWESEISHAAFLPDPSATMTGRTSIRWVEDGSFLVMRQGDQKMKPPAATWLIARDESTPSYSVSYFDSRGVSRIYHMSFEQTVWKMWRTTPRFSQRFEGTVSASGELIEAHWEKSTDGKTWEHDFDMTYRRILATGSGRRLKRA
jgi:hypothetical protein